MGVPRTPEVAGSGRAPATSESAGQGQVSVREPGPEFVSCKTRIQDALPNGSAHRRVHRRVLAPTRHQEPYGRAQVDRRETYLTIGFDDGTETTITLCPPGDGDRVAVGTATNSSSIWRMFTSRSKKGGSDVFITAAALGTAQKISLHESGVWRTAFHTEELAAKYGHTGTPEHGGDPRVLDRWQRPEGEGGWTRGFSVFVPCGHLAPATEPEDPKKPVTWLTEPQPGEVVAPSQSGRPPGQVDVATSRVVGTGALGHPCTTRQGNCRRWGRLGPALPGGGGHRCASVSSSPGLTAVQRPGHVALPDFRVKSQAFGEITG